MSIPDKIIKEIDMLSEQERQKAIKFRPASFYCSLYISSSSLTDVLFKGTLQTKQLPVV